MGSLFRRKPARVGLEEELEVMASCGTALAAGVSPEALPPVHDSYASPFPSPSPFPFP